MDRGCCGMSGEARATWKPWYFGLAQVILAFDRVTVIWLFDAIGVGDKAEWGGTSWEVDSIITFDGLETWATLDKLGEELAPNEKGEVNDLSVGSMMEFEIEGFKRVGSANANKDGNVDLLARELLSEDALGVFSSQFEKVHISFLIESLS